MAQQAAMSTEEFEDFYFRTCLMDYAALRPAMRKLAAMMEKAEYVKITGPGTDISFSIKGLPATFPSIRPACSRESPLTTSA